MKSEEKMGKRTKHNGPIEYTSKIYSFIVNDSLEKVSSTVSINRMMGEKMNTKTLNIIYTMTRIIYC